MPIPGQLSINNVPNPLGAGREDWGDNLKEKVGSSVSAGLKGLWQRICGTVPAERSVVEAGPGEYRLLRKGQQGHVRLDLVAQAPKERSAVFASPKAARIRMVPREAPTAAAPPGHEPSPQERLASLTRKVMDGNYGQLPDMRAKEGLAGSSSKAKLAATPARLEAELLSDLNELVDLAKATGEELRLPAGNPASQIFGRIVAQLVALCLPGAGELLKSLATSPAEGESLVKKLTDYAGASPQSLAGRLLGQSLKYERQPHLAPTDLAERLPKLLQEIGSNLLVLHRNGLLGKELLRSIAAVQPLAAWSQKDASKSDHLQALATLGEVLDPVTRGNVAAVDLVLADDSRNDALALKLKTIGLGDGEADSAARTRITLENTLARAKRSLAGVWRQREKVERRQGQTVAAGGFGRLRERAGDVVNRGGSDQLRIDARLLRILREEATPKGGVGIQASAQAGRDVNLLIAHVMLLQKQVDALQGNGTKELATARDTAAARVAEAVQQLPAELQRKLCEELPGGPHNPEAMPDIISQALRTSDKHETLQQAFLAQRGVVEAREAISSLSPLSEADAVRQRRTAALLVPNAGRPLTRAQRDQVPLLAKAGQAAAVRALLKEGIGPLAQEAARARDGLPPDQRDEGWEVASLHKVAQARQAAADPARAKLGTALGGADITAADLEKMGGVLDALRLYGEAEQRLKATLDDSTFGLDDKDFAQMGFSPRETATIKADLAADLGSPIEDIVRQSLTNTEQAKKINDAVNASISRLFGNGRSHLAQGMIRELSHQFPEARARLFLDTVRAAATGSSAQPAGGPALKDVFVRAFGDQLGSPDKPGSRLLIPTADRAAEAQQSMVGKVRDLADLDHKAAEARLKLAQVAKEDPARRVDLQSKATLRNATALIDASATLKALDDNGRAIQDLAAEVQSTGQELRTATGERDAQKERLTRLGQEDPRKAGLQESLQKVEEWVNSAQAAATRATDDLESARERQAGLQGKLGGDIARLRWMSKTSLDTSHLPQDRVRNEQQLREFLEAPGNREIMEALHTLHELPDAKKSAQRQIVEQAGLAEAVLQERRQVLEGLGINPDQLRAAIRSAIVEEALTWPDGLADFDPSAHRGAVEATLARWGIDPAVAGPEINEALHHSLDAGTIEDWRQEAESAFVGKAESQPGRLRRAVDAVRHFFTDSSRLDPATRLALTDSVREMRVGDAIVLARGLRGGFDTTKVPVEPTGTLTARLTAQVNERKALEVRRTDEGYEVFLKAGVTGVGSLGISASIFGAMSLGLTGSGGGARLQGAALRFPDQDSATAFLDTLLDGKKVSPQAWAKAREAAVVTDRSVKTGVEVDAMASTKNLAARLPGSEIAQHLVFDGVVAGAQFEFIGGVQAKAGASREWRWVEQTNAERRIIESERTTVVGGSVSIGLWASLPTVHDPVIDNFAEESGGLDKIDGLIARNAMLPGEEQSWGPGNHTFDPFASASANQFAYSLAGKETLTKATSLTFERDGLLAPSGNTVTRSMVVTGPLDGRELGLVRPGFASGDPQAQTKKQERERDSLLLAVDGLRADPAGLGLLKELLASAAPGDSLAATYALKEDVCETINGLLKGAARDRAAARDDEERGTGAKAEGLRERAARREKLAKDFYEDEANYAVDTIQVVTSTSVDRSQTLASVGILTVGRMAQGGVQRPAMILALPGGATARNLAETSGS